ncbi:MAG TPA: M42 family metallopeptidase [Fimbriimonadaceae bacterium]|nr:M42 family metallopeptidase [Fimbriimonadaceae bacterium]
MNVQLLKRLTEAHGVPGQEDAIRDIVREELKGICDISVDVLGNMHCVKRATKKPAKGQPKKLMIAAHMDEIGFVVKYIDGKGFLRIQTLGGWDPRMMAAQRVIVHAQSGPLNGVLMPGVKPKHLLSPMDAAKPLTTDDYFVDLGMAPAKVKRTIQLGDMVTMDRSMHEMGDLFTCKAMDDRVAVFVMIEAMKAAKTHSVDVYGIATVQEEVGLRGAIAAGGGIKPDICIAIDITLANDIPGIPDELAVTRLGSGTAIKFMDSSLICHPKVYQHFIALAKKHKIPYQIEVLPMGGTDAGGVQRQNGGTPSFTLSVPTRYVHTVNETIHKKDLKASIDIMARYIADAHNGDYTYKK